MYTGPGNVPTQTYTMPVAGADNHLPLLAPNGELGHMANDVAPEVFYDQGLYYPSANHYGYYCTGFEPQSELGDHMVFGLDGQPHYSGFHPYVYYPPNYGYAQSYNPYNPYIPGAVLGLDGSFIGTQQYSSNPSYADSSLSPVGYIPVLVQPGSDVLSNSTSGSVGYSTTAPMSNREHNAGRKYPHTSANRGAISQRNTSKFPTSESSLTVSSEGSVSNPSHNLSSSGNATQIPQNKSSSGPAQNRFNNGTGNSDTSNEPRRGLITNEPRGKSASVTDGSNNTNSCSSNAQETILIQTDKYNLDDFPTSYPNAKFFVIKSYSEDDVHKSIKYSVWSSTPNGNKRLSNAYEDAQRISGGKPRTCPIFLYFSVNASGQFCGVAEMIGPVDFHKDMNFWQQDKWTGSFPVKWHIIKDVPNTTFRNILLVNNENKPVTNSRDTQEIMYAPGINMLNIFKTSPLRTSILDDFMFYEEREKIMQEEKARFLGRSYTSYLPAVVPNINNDNHSECAKKNSENPNTSTNDVPGTKEDGNVTSCVQKMNSLTIVSEENEADNNRENVVTVGSVDIKVNGASKISSSTIT